jgi:hypothetical protein
LRARRRRSRPRGRQCPQRAKTPRRRPCALQSPSQTQTTNRAQRGRRRRRRPQRRRRQRDPRHRHGDGAGGRACPFCRASPSCPFSQRPQARRQRGRGAQARRIRPARAQRQLCVETIEIHMASDNNKKLWITHIGKNNGVTQLGCYAVTLGGLFGLLGLLLGLLFALLGILGLLLGARLFGLGLGLELGLGLDPGIKTTEHTFFFFFFV